MNYIILDIDNCISNDGWRIQHIAWHHTDAMRRYHHYHQLAPWDEAGNHDLFTGREEGIILFTSRPVMYRVTTEEWLRRQGIQWHALLMRNDDDHRPSVQVKAKQLEWLVEYDVKLSQIACAYDDRPEILEAYRRAGLKTELRSLHDVCAYTNPLTGVNHATGQKQA